MKVRILILLVFLPMEVLSLDLVKGKMQSVGMEFTEEDKINLPLVSREVYNVTSKKDVGRSVAFLNSGNNEWFRLYRKLKLFGVNTSEKTVLINSNITRWPHLKVPSEINFAPRMAQNEKVSFNQGNPSTGCLTQSPLRYGDVESDGQKEIILILDDELIVFSPKYERIVFSTFIDVSDWWQWSNDDWLKLYKEDHDGKEPPEEDMYHGLSHSWLDRAIKGQFKPAVRAYSKIFVGDFDEDGNSDVIKWEKVYRSNKKTASISWNKVRNSLTHYERDLDAQKVKGAGVTGEYLPQITTDVIIESWMRGSELTWQKGYPSKSECAGQEGQLIPEMHDPLLNDPDVLK